MNEFGQYVGDVVPGWEERPAPGPVMPTGRSVTVEPLSVDHAEALYEATCGPHDRALWTYRTTEPPESVDAMRRLVEGQLAAPDLLTFALVPAGRRAEGIASYTRIDPATGQVELAGVLFARSLQQTRAATEAIHLLMRHAFEDLGYRRFEWKCDTLNGASC